MRERVTLKVEHRCWFALKLAAVRLDITIMELVRRLGEGDREAEASYQREYKEAGK